MAEPLDPAALGVASVLKSLRTRTGLREERLSGTEVALDTLTGLDSVRSLISAGESPERAIVRAVRAAAGTLEPTMSIVADVSLGLELAADLVPDADLYGQDLGQRREALLRNWDRLHELRSASPGKTPSPRALRLEVESEALTALAAALTTGAGHGEPRRGHGGTHQAAGPRAPDERLPGQPGGTAGLRRGAHQDAAHAPHDRRAGRRRARRSAGRRRPVGRGPGTAVRAGGPLAGRVPHGAGSDPEPGHRLALPAGSSWPPARPGAAARPRRPCSRRSRTSRRRCGTAWSGTPTAGPWDGRATCANCRVRRRRRPPPTASRRCCCWRTAWRLTWSRSRRACRRWLVPAAGTRAASSPDRARRQPRRR